MRRRNQGILMGLVGGLVLLNALVAIGRFSQANIKTIEDRLDAWRQLSDEQRASYLQHYRDVNRRENAGTVWRRAWRFSRFSPEQQAHLRSLYRVMRDTVARQSAPQRRLVETSPPRFRAYFVYEDLATSDPERLESLGREAPDD